MLDDATAAHRLLEALRALALAAVPLVTRGGSREGDEDPQHVLANERRRRIFEMIEERPGIPALELRHALDLGGGVLDNHLNQLIRAGLVETRRSGYFVRLYAAGKAPKEDDPVLLPETTRDVARAVLRKPGRTSEEIAKETQLSRVRVNDHLRTLVAAGLVRSFPDELDGRKTRHEPTKRLREAAGTW